MYNDRERVTAALDLLVAGLAPFVERELEAIYQDRWQREARSSFRDNRGRNGQTDRAIRWDAHSLLTVMWDQWNRAFRNKLCHSDRSLVSELREFRNQWAHQLEFEFDDTYRMLDSVERLMNSVGSPLAKRVLREKRDLMRTKFIREAKAAYQRSQLKKRMWQDLTIYGACCLAIVIVILQLVGVQAWVFVAFVIFVFSYLGYQRVQSHPPMVFGPHECGTCRRIIYGEICPYCAGPDRAAVAVHASPPTSQSNCDDSAMPPEQTAPQPAAGT
ncbi:MAG: Swt1 family HEPN domain-containing protein [Planctomycetaceae bacterium]